MKIRGDLEARALRILRGIPDVTVVQEALEGGRHVDAVLSFAGAHAKVAIEFKHNVNAATVWQFVELAKATPRVPLVVIADQTTADARKILQEHRIGVIDGSGNLHVELPGLLMHLEGRRRLDRNPTDLPPTRLRGKAGIATQALLLDPKRAWQVQDFADRAGVSAGLAHRILVRLEREGLMESEGKGPNQVRRLTNPTALLDLWAEENVDTPTRTFAYLLARTPQRLIKQLSANLEDAGVDYALTGAAAASIVAPFITALPVAEVWTPEKIDPRELPNLALAESVADGHNIIFLQTKFDIGLAFRERVKDVWIANKFRLYLDLRRDPRRGMEQADHVRLEVIGF